MRTLCTSTECFSKELLIFPNEGPYTYVKTHYRKEYIQHMFQIFFTEVAAQELERMVSYWEIRLDK